jgi:diguanylate cyclase (GGDEF)-like protein
MLYLIIISCFLNLCFYFLLKEILKKNLDRKYLKLYDKVKKEVEFYKENRSLINKTIEEIKRTLQLHIQLYEASRKIYSFLEEEKIFSNFKEALSNFIGVKDCFLKPSLDIEPKDTDTVFALKNDSEIYGFLLLKGPLSSEEKEKFYILAQQFLLSLRRAKFYQKVQELSIRDSLTSLYNRRYFLERLKEEVNRADKFKLKFSFIMIDIDDFKKCNDFFGHLVGDYVLREVAKTIRDNIRHIDLACRYGGEEFCLLLLDTTKEGAFFAAERIRKNLEKKKIKAYDEELSITVSIGIASFPDDGKTELELIEKSDTALYIAKTKGKNQIYAYKTHTDKNP